MHHLQVAEDIDGKEHVMRAYKGKVLLITNVASQCGYTESNYKGLQQLYEKYWDRGLEVLLHRICKVCTLLPQSEIPALILRSVMLCISP